MARGRDACVCARRGRAAARRGRLRHRTGRCDEPLGVRRTRRRDGVRTQGVVGRARRSLGTARNRDREGDRIRRRHPLRSSQRLVDLPGRRPRCARRPRDQVVPETARGADRRSLGGDRGGVARARGLGPGAAHRLRPRVRARAARRRRRLRRACGHPVRSVARRRRPAAAVAARPGDDLLAARTGRGALRRVSGGGRVGTTRRRLRADVRRLWRSSRSRCASRVCASQASRSSARRRSARSRS